MNASSLFLIVVVAAAPLRAQQQDSTRVAPPDSATGLQRRQRFHTGRRDGRYRSRDAAGRGTPFDPARLIARKEALGLTAQQVQQLTALEESQRPAMADAVKDIRARRATIAAALRAGAPDTVALRQNYEALQAAAGKAHWARISRSLQARAILTEAQRGKVRGWAALRGGRWHSKGHGYRL